MNRTRVLFVLASLAGGGAERVSVNLVRALDRERFAPALAIVGGRGYYSNLIPEDVPTYYLNARRVRYSTPALSRLVRRIKPDIVFSTAPHVDAVVCLATALSLRRPKLVLRSPNLLSASLFRGSRGVPLLPAWSYSRADVVVATTQAMRMDLAANFRVPKNKMVVIPNPVDIGLVERLCSEPCRHAWFQRGTADPRPTAAAVGSLERQKDYASLLRAFSLVVKEIPARLAILGEGSLCEELKALVASLGIGSEVAFLGFQKNPFTYLARSDVFVLSSLWEGFPNVLVEAMACAVPVVATDCRSGPDEIISHQVDGLLVPPGDVESLASAILTVLRDPDLAARLAQNGRARVNRFDAARIVQEYEGVFRGVLSHDVVARDGD